MHRLLDALFHGTRDLMAPETLEGIAHDCSETERRAADAERELVEWKKARFMESRVGDEFRGLITSTTRFGFFVELENLFVEGLVPIDTLPGDRYMFQENTRKIVGQRSRREFCIGDTVQGVVGACGSGGAQAHFFVSATEAFDLEDTTGQGEAMATMATLFAQMESKATSIRVTGAHAFLRESGRWPGGGIPYGYRPVPNPDGPGLVLVPDDESSAVVREAAGRVIGGESVNAVTFDFNQRKILCPRDHTRMVKGKPRRCECRHEKHADGCPTSGCNCQTYRERHAEWQGGSLGLVLRNRALLGQVIHNNQTVPGNDGMPLVRAKPIIDLATWNRLQKALDAAAIVKKRTQKASALLNIAYCGESRRAAVEVAEEEQARP